MSFFKKLKNRMELTQSCLCVGLDPHPSDVGDDDSEDALYTFCKTIIDATSSHAVCYKPNIAFFEKNSAVLKRLISDIPPEIPILLDCKRGDIGSTAAAYAAVCYDEFKADAVTLSPLMGWDSIAPFVTGKYSDKCAFLLCKTSNPGSNEFLGMQMTNGDFLYEHIAAKVGGEYQQHAPGRLGLVVGATDRRALRKARIAAGPDVCLLAPGVGAQGADLRVAMEAGWSSESDIPMLIPISRGISRAENMEMAAREFCHAMKDVRTELNNHKQETSNLLLPFQREFLKFSLSLGVLKFGSFVLKSGRTSPYFFNAGLFDTGAALDKLGNAYAAAIVECSELMTSTTEDSTKKSPSFDIIFGPAYKGISLGAVVCAALHRRYQISVGFSYNRKEQKDHGEGGTLVGACLENKRVLIVDDVITAGTAIRECHEMLQQNKVHSIVGVVIALDRAEKRSLEDPVSAVQAVQRDLKIPVVASIVNLPQLQMYLEEQKEQQETLKQVAEYRAEYGV